MVLKRCLLAVSLVIAILYITADLCELWQIVRVTSLPPDLLPYRAVEAWSENRRLAITDFSLRIFFGALSLCGLFLFLQSNHIIRSQRFINHLLPSASEMLQTAAFWGWWTLLSYVYEVLGFNISGWSINSRPLKGRIWYELPLILGAEVVLAVIFVWLRRKCSRPMAWLIFTLAGIGGWTAYREMQLRWSLRHAKPLVSFLEAQGQPAQLERLRELLRVRGKGFPERRVLLGRIPSASYLRSLTQETILYNHTQQYDGWGETEAVLVSALFDRSLGRTWKTYYAANWTTQALRGLMAYGLGTIPAISTVFGVTVNDMQSAAILSLAIGDFLMSVVRQLMEPVWLWLARANQQAEDEATAWAGYAVALVMATSRTSVILEYELAPLYEFLRSGRYSVKKRIERIKTIGQERSEQVPVKLEE